MASIGGNAYPRHFLYALLRVRSRWFVHTIQAGTGIVNTEVTKNLTDEQQNLLNDTLSIIRKDSH